MMCSTMNIVHQKIKVAGLKSGKCTLTEDGVGSFDDQSMEIIHC